MTISGVITTTFGDIVVEFYTKDAPNTVQNFKELSKRGFYDGLIFHRIVPGFVIQGGDPNTKIIQIEVNGEPAALAGI